MRRLYKKIFREYRVFMITTFLKVLLKASNVPSVEKMVLRDVQNARVNFTAQENAK
jgi:hypothetical protein